MVVAVWGPVTNDCVEAVGTSVPWGVVITNPAKRRRDTVIWPLGQNNNKHVDLLILQHMDKTFSTAGFIIDRTCCLRSKLCIWVY